MSTISVVIVNFNSGVLLSQCLRALAAQTRKADSVIVVDNNSQDESLRDAVSFDWVEIVKVDKNIGFAAASNLGVEKSVGCEWVALLNPDAFAEPNWIFALDAQIKKRRGYSSFACRMMCHAQPDRMDGAGDAYHISGKPWRISHGKLMMDDDLRSKEVFGACAGAALYNRQVFLDVGGLDEDYFCYLEDVDLSFRLQLSNHRCLYVPEAVVSHIGSAISGRGSDFQVYHAHRNIIWTYFKNMPTLLLILFLPLHLLMNIYSVFVFSIRGQAKVIIKAKIDALSDFSTIIQKRKKNLQQQKARTIDIIRRLNYFLG